MLYLTAQPDTTYFTWQLEIQLRNLKSLGISKDKIQVLVAYNSELGLNPAFRIFIDENMHLANFFTYIDKRVNPKYTSSVRPNVLSQHFKKYSELSQEVIMYHDSDILFSRIPQIENLYEDQVIYVSDTRNYLDVNYIRNTAKEELLDEMLNIVGLSKEKLIKENDQTGGAQYILKDITSKFWDNVEKDSEELYVLMNEYNTKLWEELYPKTKEYRSKKRGIQAWCADMWAVLWNLWFDNKVVKIHPEMAFSWPYSPIEDWSRLAIQHYSGNIEDKAKFFKKTEYLNYMPWYDDSLESISDNNCSYEIVQFIKQRRKELDLKREKFDNATIYLCTNSDSVDNELLFFSYKKYIQKYTDIEVKLLTNTYTKINNAELLKAESFSKLYIPIHQLIDIIYVLNLLHQSQSVIASCKSLFKTDVLFTEAFSKMLDIELLNNNKGKFNKIQSSDQIIYIKNNQVLDNRINLLNKLEISNAYQLS